MNIVNKAVWYACTNVSTSQQRKNN